MNKLVIRSILILFLMPGINSFAQKIPTKALNPAQLERAVLERIPRLAPVVPGVYIPTGTTLAALRHKIALTAQKANIPLNEDDIYRIATIPERLIQFQQQLDQPLFSGKTLSYPQGLRVLQTNQEKFALARASKQYEAQWQAFTAGESGPFRRGKSYFNTEYLAKDIYNFYVQHIGVENLPRVRMVRNADIEGVVCEFPVNGLSTFSARPTSRVSNVSPDAFVVFRLDDGYITLIHRALLEFVDGGEPAIYRVLE